MSVNRKYMCMQGLFWMISCTSYSFISLYLQDKGLDNRSIGIFTAFFGVVSAVGQPVVGRFCDHSDRFTWKDLLLRFACVFVAVCILMLVVPGKIAGTLLFGMMFVFGNLMLPLLNGAMSYYQQRKETVNFGVSRGIGSGLFALTALLIGILAERCGADVVPAAGLMIAALFLPVVWRMPCERIGGSRDSSPAAANGDFGKRYPSFLLMTVAFILLAASHNMVGTYLLQIMQSLGGGSGETGVAMAIQAMAEVPVLFAFSRLLKRFCPKTLMMFASCGYGVKAVAYALAFRITDVYMIQLTQMISYALFASASVYYVIDTLADEDQVTGQALMASTMAAGNVLGSLLGGWVIDMFGISYMLYVNIAVAAIGMVFAICPARMPKRTPVHPKI